MRKTKIIATLGPAVENYEIMRRLIKAGCDVARLNVAHGTVESHRRLKETFLKAANDENKVVGVMMDIKGPEIRVKTAKLSSLVPETEILLGEGGDIELNQPVVYEYLSIGTKVLIHDGDIVLETVDESKGLWRMRVVRGGVIKPRMGVNIPDTYIPIPYIQDRDLHFIKSIPDVDFIAASFVRNARDVCELRKVLKELSIDAQIISKIENRDGVENIESILEVSDGIMVARGDLGTEIPVENLPGVQKYLLKKAREHGKPGIIATQILETMIHNPYPTRAEVSDIANAILDGADALMLSGETAIGKYPVEAVEVLSKVAEKADVLLSEHEKMLELRGTISESVSNAAVLLAKEINADALLILTRSGKTARLISRHRPSMPIFAVSYSRDVLRKMTLYWGVQGFEVERFEYADRSVKEAIDTVEKHGFVKKGDVLVIAGGEPSGIPGTTNFVWVQIVGDVIARGSGFGKIIVSGEVCRYPELCDVVIVSELCDEMDFGDAKAIIVESPIYDPDKLNELAAKGKSIVAGTGKIKIEGKITVDPERGIIWH